MVKKPSLNYQLTQFKKCYALLLEEMLCNVKPQRPKSKNP